MKRGQKKGQATIFIIIAIAIIAVALLIYFFYPKIKSTFGFGEQSPDEFLKSCVNKEVKEAVLEVSKNGGSINPENYFLYKDDKLDYLCYTNEDYKTCVMQQPMLKEKIESEVDRKISAKVSECVNSLRKDLESRGYSVSINTNGTSVELIPKKILVNIDGRISITKQNSKSYNGVTAVFDSSLYELVGIANSILNWEARYGDSEVTLYMNLYHNIKVEKLKQTDGTKVYIITDKNTKDKFQFATRSLAWPG